MVLEGDTSPNTSIRYQIINEAGETIETTGGKDEANGREVVAFTGSETKQYTVKPVIAGRFEYGVAYTGSINPSMSFIGEPFVRSFTADI